MTESSSEADDRIQVPVSDLNASISSAETGISATFYSTFEERFRGAREDIAKRQSVYLPILEKAGILQSNAAVLDVGCGRGEWLELLGERGYKAKGVDFNKKTVLDCQAKGLDIAYGEAVQYLRAQPADSYAAVTSFHLVEHLPFASLMELLAEIHRVLRPGGVVILETPNPENIIVGACNFYFDPTHKAPIPPDLLRFLAEQAGFASPYIARVNSDCSGTPLTYLQREAAHSLQINAVIHLLNLNHYIAPDYAVIAQKNGGASSIDGSAEISHLCKPMPMDITGFRLLEAESKEEWAKERVQEAEARVREAEVSTQAQIAAIQNSYSWKVSAPIRVIGSFFNFLRHGYIAPDAAVVVGREKEEINIAVSAEACRLSEPTPLGSPHYGQLEAETKVQRTERLAQEAEARAQEAEARAQEAEARARAQIATIYNSYSWKVSAPVRGVGRVLKLLFNFFGHG